MKNVKSLILVLIFSSTLSLIAQDSIQGPVLLIRPYFENGIDFIRNDELKQNYNTQSKYFLGFGIQFGKPTQKFTPYFQYTYSSTGIETEIAPDVIADSTFKNNQFSVGIYYAFRETKNVRLRTRVGYCYSMIEESFYNIDSSSHGFQIGIGAEKRIIKNSRIYFDISYNFQKMQTGEFRDLDMTKLSFGFII